MLRYKQFKEITSGMILIFLKFLFEFFIVILLFPLFFKILINFLKNIDKLRLSDRLQQIVVHPESNRFFGIFKVIIPTNDHNTNIRKFLFHYAT